MLSRTVFSSRVLLLLAICWLTLWAIPAEARPALPQAQTLTPQPTVRQRIVPPPARIGPRAAQPTATPTLTGTVTATTVALTPTAVVTMTVALTPTAASALTLQPTSTATNTATITSTATITASPSVPRAVVITATAPALALPAFVMPTVTPRPATPVMLPTPTPSRTPTTVTPTIAALAPITSTGVLPSPAITASVPLPPSYQAQGTFASQTVYTDSTIAQQQGSFTIVQSAALNVYGANQQYTLRTQRAVGVLDEINVYQIDDYIAVSYTGGDWMLVRRDQGSNIVRAIQPITDLAILFPRVLGQAEFVGQEEVAGISSLGYRIDDPRGQGARLIQPLLALTGEVRSLKLEVWVAVPGGFVVAYNFQVELAGARVLDLEGNEVRADQAVTWTYQLTPADTAQPIAWPADAPTPNSFPVPGFAAGAFPIPPRTELLSLVGGVPDLISAQTPVQVDSFYRTELLALGWMVEGEGGLLQCSKGGVTFQILITEETATEGSRISILPGE